MCRYLNCLLLCFSSALSYAGEHSDWTHYGGSQHGMQYSSLEQINTDNVAQLKPAWIHRTGETGQGAVQPFTFQANPILVNGRLYIATGSGIVIALDPETGAEFWRHDPQLDRSKPSAERSNRGVSAWTDPLAEGDVACRHRIFAPVLDSRLLALDAVTGELCRDFGREGAIYLNEDVRLRCAQRGLALALGSATTGCWPSCRRCQCLGATSRGRGV